MRKRYNVLYLAPLILSLLFIVVITLQPVRVQGAVAYDSVIEINHARDANGKDLAGGVVRITNLDNGTVHGDYTLNSTGGYRLDGVGNATNYLIEIFWQGSKVNQTQITTSATAGTVNTVSPIDCKVFTLTLNFKYKTGTLTATKVLITAPNGTTLTHESVSSISQEQAQNGTWTIEVYYRWWKVNRTSFSLDSNLEMDVVAVNLIVNVGGMDVFVKTGSLVSASYVDTNKELTVTVSGTKGSTSEIYVHCQRPVTVKKHSSATLLVEVPRAEDVVGDRWWWNSTGSEVYLKLSMYSTEDKVILSWRTVQIVKPPVPKAPQVPAPRPITILDWIREVVQAIIDFFRKLLGGG